jgi:hypothetical protein
VNSRSSAAGTCGKVRYVESTLQYIKYLEKRRTIRYRYCSDTSSYAVNYSSRILAPTGRVEVAYLLGEMMKSL